MIFHKEASAGRWFKFTILEQLANVGSEVDRAITWKNRGNKEYAEQSFFRSLELLTLTITDKKNKGPRLRELCRVREFLIDYFLFDNQYGFTDDAFWRNYFYNFAYAAAVAKGR